MALMHAKKISRLHQPGYFLFNSNFYTRRLLWLFSNVVGV